MEKNVLKIAMQNTNRFLYANQIGTTLHPKSQKTSAGPVSNNLLSPKYAKYEKKQTILSP